MLRDRKFGSSDEKSLNPRLVDGSDLQTSGSDREGRDWNATPKVATRLPGSPEFPGRADIDLWLG
jgi:hypothetical protein